MRDSDPFCDRMSRFIELCEEKELDRRVSEEKAKFEALCKDSFDKILMLRLAQLIYCAYPMSAPATIIVEKSSREKCLIALASGCTTSEEVCRRLNPQIDQCPKQEKRRAMKATAMLLLRLKSSKLAHVYKEEKTLRHQITRRGLNRLFHYPEEREKERKVQESLAKAHELHVRTDEIVNLNEETVASTKRMHENTDKVLKSLGSDLNPSTRALQPMHSMYGEFVSSLSRVIVVLQRAHNADNDTQWIDALVQSTKVLKNVGYSEALLSELLISTREERKYMEDKIHRLDLQLEQLKKEEQKRREKQEKDRKARKLFDALFLLKMLGINFQKPDSRN